MKADWEIKKLGEVCSFYRGLTYSKKDEVESSKNAVLRSNNIDLITNKLDFSEIKYISDNICIDDSKKVKQGTLLICTANGSKVHLGKVALIDSDYGYAFGGFMGLIEPNKRINPTFLYYQMTSERYKDFIKSLSDGANINNLKFNDLAKFKIPVPSLVEQKRIVEILDQKFAQIEQLKQNAEKNLQNAKELFQAELTKAFSNDTWEKKRLGEVATVTSSKRIFKDEYVSEGIPFYRTKEIKEISHNEPISLELFISKQKYEEIKQNFGVPQIGDVLISAVGTIGEILVIENENPFYFKDGNIIWLKNIKGISPIYLKYQLKSFVDELKNLTRGAAYNALTIEKLKECKTPLPPLSEQKRIVEQLDSLSQKVRQLEEIYTKQITNCDELKQSFLKKAFEGEL